MYHDHHGHLQLADKKAPSLNKRIFDAAAKWLHQNKGFNAENLNDEKPAALVNEINRVFSQAVKNGLSSGIKHEIPSALIQALDKNVFVFSGLKAYHELKQASTMLIDENGGIKPWNTFKQDMLKLHQTYNLNYLNTEYNFATQTAQMAAKWNDIEKDGDEYWLQFRTSKDEKVRASHEALHNTTLPPSDKFWDSYMPPLDWNCRCTVVQVLADKYAKSNSAEAVAKGETATTRIDKKGVNRAAMFRFNPGKQKVIFPQNHPYFKVQQEVSNTIDELYINAQKIERKKVDDSIKQWAKTNIPEQGIKINSDKLISGSAILLRKNVKNIAAHLANPDLKVMAIQIPEILKRVKPITQATLNESIRPKSEANLKSKRQRGVSQYNYYSFEYKDETYRLNMEVINGLEFPHSINKIIDAD
ncbi:MAG: phage minor head protein [Bacteroidales bacterium]|nr:phage minor head protein [Bacteroidales bacterium]